MHIMIMPIISLSDSVHIFLKQQVLAMLFGLERALMLLHDAGRFVRSIQSGVASKQRIVVLREQ